VLDDRAARALGAVLQRSDDRAVEHERGRDELARRAERAGRGIERDDRGAEADREQVGARPGEVHAVDDAGHRGQIVAREARASVLAEEEHPWRLERVAHLAREHGEHGYARSVRGAVEHLEPALELAEAHRVGGRPIVAHQLDRSRQELDLDRRWPSVLDGLARRIARRDEKRRGEPQERSLKRPLPRAPPPTQRTHRAHSPLVPG
jgi:hypothetical protein